MITTLIGIQTFCVATATTYAINYFRHNGFKLKVHSKSKGFKHYKSF